MPCQRVHKTRRYAFWGLSMLGALLLVLARTLALYYANGADNIDYGLNGLGAANLATLAAVSLGGSLLLPLGMTLGTGSRLSPDNRGPRLGVLFISAGIALLVVALTLPWSEVSALQNAYPNYSCTFHFSNWLLQQSGSNCVSSWGTDWWYDSPMLFLHAGAVVLYCGAGILCGIALSVVAIVLGRPRGVASLPVASHPRAAFFAGLAGVLAVLTSATLYAVLLPAALSLDNGSDSQYYPYDHSFWGSSTLAGPPATQYYWGPDWAWVLLFVAAMFTLLGSLLAFRSSRKTARTTATSGAIALDTPPP
jgi:hypothetical protein